MFWISQAEKIALLFLLVGKYLEAISATSVEVNFQAFLIAADDIRGQLTDVISTRLRQGDIFSPALWNLYERNNAASFLLGTMILGKMVREKIEA